MSKARSRAAIAVAALAVAAGIALLLASLGKLPTSAKSAWQAVASAVTPAASSVPDGDAGPDAAFVPRRQAAPLSSAQLGAPLVNGHFVTACGAPDTMKVAVKADVRMGRATSVKVTTDPPDPAVAACVEKFVRDQRWDISPKTGHMTVRY